RRIPASPLTPGHPARGSRLRSRCEAATMHPQRMTTPATPATTSRACGRPARFRALCKPSAAERNWAREAPPKAGPRHLPGIGLAARRPGRLGARHAPASAAAPSARLRHAPIGQRVGALVARVAGMAAHPAPVHLVARDQLVELLPQVDVLDR